MNALQEQTVREILEDTSIMQSNYIPTAPSAPYALHAEIAMLRKRLEDLLDEHGPQDHRVLRMSKIIDSKLNQLRRVAG